MEVVTLDVSSGKSRHANKHLSQEQENSTLCEYVNTIICSLRLVDPYRSSQPWQPWEDGRWNMGRWEDTGPFLCLISQDRSSRVTG